jgi:hypothetical protein
MPAINTIILRQGPASEWISVNPVLASGEPGFDTTNNIIKVGDGVKTWTLLPSAGLGSQGIQGLQGFQGTQGITGNTGIQGVQGSIGSQGTQGITGSQGSQGSQGITGNTGSQGSQGTQGVTGNTGSQGSQGTQGITGSTGSQGSQGTQGVTGNTGSQGVQGTQGITGSTGSQGVQGTIGSQGVQGLRGLSSATVRGNISTTGTLSSFNISEGYSVGYLDLFQNGVKLLSGSDFTATNGTSVTLSNSVPSGTVLEYISLGASITSTNYTKLDNISSSFNGSSVSFGLAFSGTAYYPVSANTLGIYVGGVAQEPISSYSVSGSNIIFTEAPTSGLTFWGVGYGTTAVATLNGIAPGSSGSPAISSSNDIATGFYFPSSGNISVAGNLGIGTSSPSTLLDINNNKFRVRNSKTPVSATDTGNQGDICWDSSYIYVCINTNSWTRTPISVWSSDPYFSYVSLLLHMNETGSSFIDSSSTPKTITAFGNATQSAAQSKFGVASALFDGSGDYLSGTASDATRFSGNFTVEFWAFVLTHKTYNVWFDCRSSVSSASGFTLASNSSGQMCFFTNNSFAITGSSAFTASQWTHFALVRSGSTITLYQGGQSIGTTTNSTNFSDGAFGVGISLPDLNHSVNGYIDELRITKDIARTITVPTAAFPDYNT